MNEKEILQRLNNGNYPAFYVAVWKECLKIPYGETRSYKDIACKLKNPKASRAVAMSLKHNPFAPFIPCHRVICSDGTIGGYSGPGGIAAKIAYLTRENKNFIAKYKS